MAAAPYTGTLVFSNGARQETYYITASDVANAYYVFPNGSSDLVLPVGGNWILKDIILSAAGTDTTRSQIFVNGNTRGLTVVNSANLATNPSRQFLVSPIGFAGGSALRFQQLA